MITKIFGVVFDTDNDFLVSRRDGMVDNGYSSSRENRRTVSGIDYIVTVTHPDGSESIEFERDGVYWIRFPGGFIEGTRLSDGLPVDC